MRIAVFCSSSSQVDEIYFKAARQLGRTIAENGYGLLYGGTNQGLMQEVADGCLEKDGDVLGIIPECIYRRGVAAEGKVRLLRTPDMKERKQQLQLHADAFVALPGGWGTLEEMTEMISSKQLGVHRKAIVFLNVGGYYEGLKSFIAKGRESGFISSRYDGLYTFVDTVEEAMDYIRSYTPAGIESKY